VGPFDVLGIAPGADEETMEQAYRERVKEAHPDHGGSPEEFKRVRAAYEDLRNGAVGPASGNGDTATGDTDSAGDGADPYTRSRPRDRKGAGSSGHAGKSATERSQPSTIEYLDYEVLTDRGWGLDDDDLFERAADAGLGPSAYGQFLANPGESVLQAAENRGLSWPFACRGGACANCAVVVVEGDISMPVDHILPEDMLERGIRLTCRAVPATDELKVVFNVGHLPELEEFRLPPQPFK